MYKRELVTYRRSDVGFVFQFYNLVPNLTALENVELAVQVCKDHLDPAETLEKVGLKDREVHSYINRETWILTVIGIAVGIPLGFAFAQTLGVILKLPGIFLETELHLTSYLYAGGLTLIFALIVQIITNRSLDDIDPVTALKSAE